MNIKEFFHVSEFKRYDEFQKQPAEQYRPKELDSIDVDETLKNVPESSVQPGSKGADAAGGRGRRNAADDRQDATRHSGENTGGSQGTATANATGAKSAAMRIRAMTHQVAESVGGLATGIAATVCAAVIAVTLLTNYTAPPPDVSDVWIEPGRYDVVVAADVRNLNEEQDYAFQVYQGDTLIESVPIERELEEAAKAYFENLRPGTRYSLRIVGDNGAVGGYVTYYSAFFDTVGLDKPYARLEYSVFSPGQEPFAEVEYSIRIEDGTIPAENYEVTLYRPGEEPEVMETEPYVEEGETFIYGFFSTEIPGDYEIGLTCTWNGGPLKLGRWTVPVTIGQDEPYPYDEPAWIEDFNVNEEDGRLYFSGRAYNADYGLVLDVTYYYGTDHTQVTLEPTVEPDGYFFCETEVDPDAEAYGYVLYAWLSDGDRTLLTSADQRPLDRDYPEYGASYDYASPDEAILEVLEEGGYRITLPTYFHTDDERFAYRVYFLNANMETIGFYEGQDESAWAIIEDLSAWTAVRYESIGIFSTTIVYDEQILERTDPDAGLSVSESLTYLSFFVNTEQDGSLFDPEFVAHVTLTTPDGETEYSVALRLPSGTQTEPDATLILPYDAVSYSYLLIGNSFTGERVIYERADDVPLAMDRSVYGGTFTRMSADELRSLYLFSPDGTFSVSSGFSASDPCFFLRLTLIDAQGVTVGSYSGSDPYFEIACERDFAIAVYESVGMFREEHVYASESDEVYIPQGTLSATESTNMLSFAGSVGPVPMPEGSELRLSLTLHGTTDTVTEEILTPDAQGQFNCSIKVHYEDTAYSCTLTHINRYGTVTGLSYLDHIGLTADRSYAASFETVTADAALELQAESADGSIRLNTGFSSQDPTFLYRVALADENGTVVTSYTGTDPEVVLKPDKEWSQLIYYSLGDYVNEYVYAKKISLAYVGEATVHVAESVAELLFSGEMNLQEADYEPVIRLQVTRHGASDDTEVMDLELEQNGTFSVPVALDYDTTAYSYVLQYSSPTGAFVTLASEDHTALTVSHEYGATYTQVSADNVAATLFEGQVTIQTGFTGTSDVFGYRVELQDENGETVASYTGSDPVVTLQPGKAWTRIVYTDIGQFRTEHVYGSMSYLTFKGQLLNHEESETAATLTLSGKTNLKDSTYGSQLSMDLTLIGAGSEDLHFDLTLDADGTYSVTQRLDYETLSYAYTLYFTTASGERVAFYESGTKDLTASRSYTASFTEHTADELEALQGSSSSISFDTAFFTADEAFYYTVTLLDEDGQPVAAYSGRDASVTLTPTGGWVSVRYEKFGEFRTPHSYGSQTYSVFEGTVSNASVSETVNTVTLTGKTNLKEAAFDSALSLELRLKSNGWTTVNAVPVLNADGSYSFTANLEYEHTAYAYTLCYTSASGMQKVLLEVPETALTVSHDYGAQYQTLTADQADALQNGSSLTLNTGFSSSDPAFVYRILLKDDGQNVVASYQGTAASVTLTPTGEWTTIVFESVGLFASEHVYSSESSNKFSGSVSGLSASDTANTLTLSGKASFPQPGTVEQISIRLTLIGGAGAVIEDTIPLGQDGSFTYSAMVAQDTVKYKYELFYLNTVQQTKTLYTSPEVALSSGHDYSATYTRIDADEAERMISQAGGQLALNTAFSTPDPAYYYRVTVKDANGDVIASYEGTDAQIVLQPVGVLESVTYTSLGSFRGGPYVYAEYVYHVFAGTVSGLTETEAVNAVTISGTTNLPQAGFDTTLKIYVTLNASSATSGGQVVESELQYDSSGQFTYTQALAYATQSYRYRLTFSGKNGEEKEMYSSDLIPLNVSHAYGGSYTRISADEAHILAAQTQDGSVTFQSGFSATDPAFIYRVSLKNPTGATVAQYSGSASQITLTPTGEWSSIVYESVGLFEPEYVYETFASDPFAGSLTNMDVTEDVTALVFSASTNLHQAGFDTQPGIRVTLTGNEEKSEGASSADTGDSGFGTTLEFTEDLTILQDGSFELRFPIYFTTESYTYEVFYTDSAGQEGILAQGGDEITLSHYPQNLTFTWPDMDDLEVLYVNSTDGSVSLDMGSAGTSAFGYRMQFFDQNGSLILEKTGTEQNCTCQLTDLPYSVTCYYVGFFRDTVRYPATNAYLHVPYVYVEEDTTPYGYVSFTGFCDFPYLSYPTEATVELTLNGATSQTVEEPLEYDQEGNFSFQSLVYQDTQSYSYKIYYLSKAGVKRECYSSETLTYTPLNGFDAEYDRPTADDLSESGHDENVPINLTTNFSSNRSILFYRVKLLDDNGNVLASYEGTDPSIVLNPVGTWTSVRYSSVGAFRSEYVFAEYTYTIFVPTAGTPQKTEYFNRIELDMDSNFHEAPYDLDVRIRYTLTVPPEKEYDTAGLNVTEPLEWDDEGHISFAIPLRMDASAYSYTVYYYDRAQLYQELVSEQGVTLSYSREEDPGYPYYTLSDADVEFGEEGTCTISIPSDPEAAENGFYIIYYLYKEGGEYLGFATTLDGNAVFENVELPNTLYLQGSRSCDFSHTVSDYGQIDGLQEQLVTLDIPWVELDESGNLNGDGTISVPFEILSEQTVPDTYQSVEFTLSYDNDSETVVSADVTGSTGTLVIPKVPGSGSVLVSQAVLHAEGAFGGHERIVEMPVESSYEWPLTMSAELLYVQVEETGPVVPVFSWSREGAGSEDASLKIRDTSTQETDLSVISESPGIVYFYPDNGAITSGTHVLECYLIDAQQDAMTDPVYFTVNADVNGSDRIFTFEEPESTSVLTTYNADGTVNLYMDLGFTTDDPDLFLCGSVENYETGNLGETVKTTNRVLALEDLPVDVSGIRFGVGLTVDGVDYWIRNGMYEFSGFAEPGFIGMTLSQNGLSIDLYEDERVAYDADSVFISADGGTPVAVTFEPGPNEGVLYFFSSDAQYTQAQSVTLTIPANNYAAGYESITALTTVKGNLLTPMTLVATQD